MPPRCGKYAALALQVANPGVTTCSANVPLLRIALAGQIQLLPSSNITVKRGLTEWTQSLLSCALQTQDQSLQLAHDSIHPITNNNTTYKLSNNFSTTPLISPIPLQSALLITTTSSLRPVSGQRRLGLYTSSTFIPRVNTPPLAPLRCCMRSFSSRHHNAPPRLLQSYTHIPNRLHFTSPQKRSRLSSASHKMMATQEQTRAHGGGGHNHHHHHHNENLYLTSKNKNDAAVRITRIGLYSNLAMAVAKAAGGYVFNSQSMTADAWHSLTDLASDVLTLATVSWSIRPPTDSFPAGFGKVESLGSLGVSGMLLAGGVIMCLSSWDSLSAHFFANAAAAATEVHGHSHGGGAPSIHAAWLAAGTVLVKEWLYQATMKVARERKSGVLASNAIHHRIDSLTGIVALLAIVGSNIVRDATWLDPVGGMVISLMVIRAGLTNTIEAMYELADRSIDASVKRSVRKHAQLALTEDTGSSLFNSQEAEIIDVTGIKSGQNYLVDIELAVPATWTIERSRRVEEKVRRGVGYGVRGVRRVRVRFLPKGLLPGATVAGAVSDSRSGVDVVKWDEFIPGDVSPPESETEENDHAQAHGQNHGNMKESKRQ